MNYLLLRLKRFCGFIAGFVFFIAGIFKLLDPVGAGLVMKEYLDFMHLGFLSFAAKPAAVALALLETLTGAALVTGVWRRLTAVIALVMQSVFTVLTLFLVIFNPQMDCGCFGEAIHLTHLQTFIKNIILILLLVAFTFPFRYLGGPKRHKYVSFGIVAVSVLAFAVYSLAGIPFVDYTDFRPAAALQAGSAFATDEDDMYEAVFVYEKDGAIREFTLGHLPDSTWSFLETRTVLKKGYENVSVNLSFYDSEGEYHDSLAVSGKVMVVSIYDPELKPAAWEEVAEFVTLAGKVGFRPLVLVASTPQQIQEQWNDMPKVEEVLNRYLYYSDFKTLITMNRSNCGITYFSDGYLVRKWAARSCPDVGQLREIYVGDDTETIIEGDAKGGLAFQGFLLYVFAVMLLL